jgi:hypothetical protein
VQAKLDGFPSTKSPNAQYELTVSGVAEYQWKVGASATECQSTDGYSGFVPAATPIKIDLASRAESPAIVAVCVLGKSTSGAFQNFPTMATWVWAPELPVMTDQIDLIDGQNEIKIMPKVVSGNWMIDRHARGWQGIRRESNFRQRHDTGRWSHGGVCGQNGEK